MAGLRYPGNGTSLALDVGRCVGCGVCTEVCPHGVFGVEDRKARILDRETCIECGACQRNCTPGAITVAAGVGCATAIINKVLRGTEDCGCSAGDGGDAGCC